MYKNAIEMHFLVMVLVIGEFLFAIIFYCHKVLAVKFSFNTIDGILFFNGGN